MYSDKNDIENYNKAEAGTMNLQKANFKTAIICTLIFFLIQLIGIFHHEPWMDELQAFQIAMNSHSLSSLFYNMRYEGHPAGWHLILYLITCFTNNIFYMQLVHIIIASAAIFILFSYAPFSLVEKIFLALSYFLFYEFAQISRCYVLSTFSVISICAVIGEKYYKRKLSDQPAFQPSLFYLLSFLLLLLANSALLGLVISGALGFYFLWVIWNEKTAILSDKRLKTSFGLSILIVLFGWAVSAIQIMPREDYGGNSLIPMGFDLSRTGVVITQLLLAYFPFPKLGKVQCWSTYIILPDTAKTLVFPTIIVFTAIALILVKKPKLLFFYCMATIGISLIFLYVHVISPHYFGHHFIVLLACLWLERYVSPNPNIMIVIRDSFIAKLKKISFYVIMTVQVLAGLYMYCMDLIYPFSNCKQTGEYITNTHLNRYPLMGGIDFYIVPLSYYVNKPIYDIDRDDTLRYIIWDKKRMCDLQPAQFFNRMVTQVNKSKNDTALLCLYFPLYSIGLINGESDTLVEGNIDATHRIKCVKKITTPCMNPNNNYFLYLVWKK